MEMQMFFERRNQSRKQVLLEMEEELDIAVKNKRAKKK